MNKYRYKAITHNGKKIQGVIEAVDEYTAVLQIKNTCPILLEIHPIKKQRKNILSMEIGKKKIDEKELSVICSQFAIILRSGISIHNAMEMIADQIKNKQLREIFQKSAEDVEKGNGVAQSLEKNCSYFPATFIETIRAGEESGTIDRSFSALQAYYEKSYKTTQKIRQALAYPIFVLIIAVVVIAVVMNFVIPELSKSMTGLGGELPIMTKAIITISDFTRKNIIWLILVMIAIAILAKVYYNTEKGKINFYKLQFKIPIIGNIIVLNGAAQFANTMSTLIASGLSISNSLEVTGKVLDNYLLGLETRNIVHDIESGEQLGESIAKIPYFPDTLSKMCSVGEESGELDSTLSVVGMYFDNEAEHATQKAISKLEPTLMVVMAVIAGFIVMSIYLPIFQMYDLM